MARTVLVLYDLEAGDPPMGEPPRCIGPFVNGPEAIDAWVDQFLDLPKNRDRWFSYDKVPLEIPEEVLAAEKETPGEVAK